MNSSTNSPSFEELHEVLHWVERTLPRQPADLRQEYTRAGQETSRALTQPVYSVMIQLPNRLAGDTIATVRSAWTRIHAGGPLNSLLRKPCYPSILAEFARLAQHSSSLVRDIARLAAYEAARDLLERIRARLADPQSIAFDAQGQLAASDSVAADRLVRQWCQHADWLRLADQLFPAWKMHSFYNEVAAALADRVLEQGRALANHYTYRLIRDITSAWKSGDITRGLTLFIPYLDEQRFRMETYRVVVIPAGRIVFRPEFVVGACRVSQRHVRKDPSLSQATRWQLLSQLDGLIQAFEAKQPPASG